MPKLSKQKQTVAWAAIKDDGTIATVNGRQPGLYLITTHNDFFEAQDVRGTIRKVIITEVKE
jgi:hypothetical protein